MKFAVKVERENGQFAAWLVGVPEVRVTGPTRPEALEAMQMELSRRLEQGELAALDVPTDLPIHSLAGKYADDPTLREICDEANAERDREEIAE